MKTGQLASRNRDLETTEISRLAGFTEASASNPSLVIGKIENSLEGQMPIQT